MSNVLFVQETLLAEMPEMRAAAARRKPKKTTLGSTRAYVN